MTASVQALGIEGIVAKRSDSIDIPGKESDAWRKHRFNQEDEFIIGGYIQGGQNFSELPTPLGHRWAAAIPKNGPTD